MSAAVSAPPRAPGRWIEGWQPEDAAGFWESRDHLGRLPTAFTAPPG